MSAIPASPRQAGHHITSPTSPRSIGSLVSLIPVGLSTSAPSGPTLTASVERARTTQAAPGQYAANKSHSVPRAQVARTKSAPTSPAGRVHPAGLTPLSKIAPIHLESAPIPHAESSRDGALAASLHQGGSAGGAAVVGGDGQVYQRHVSQPLPLQRPAQQHRVRATTTALPPLLNPAARIRVGARPGKFNGSSASSASGSETEGFDSDSTFVPGRAAMRPKQSLSQPDLTALRSRLEGWAGGVAKENAAAEERKAREARRRTPPSRPVPLNTVSAPVGELRSKSQTSLSGMRKSPSPRMSPALISPMTPVLSSSSDGSSPRFGRSFSGGLGGSEDADDDWDGTTDSPSSGSLTFSPKHRTRQRQTLERERDRTRGGLGLSFGPDTPPTPKEEPLPVMIERRLQKSDLFFLRALAVIPSIWGMAVMLLAFVSGELYMESWPWGVDWSREALERLVAGGPALEGPIRKVARGDMVLAMAWVSCLPSVAIASELTYRPCAPPTSASSSPRAWRIAGVRTIPCPPRSPACSRSSASAGPRRTSRFGSSALSARSSPGSLSA